jgi:hypothetical protein
MLLYAEKKLSQEKIVANNDKPAISLPPIDLTYRRKKKKQNF